MGHFWGGRENICKNSEHIWRPNIYEENLHRYSANYQVKPAKSCILSQTLKTNRGLQGGGNICKPDFNQGGTDHRFFGCYCIINKRCDRWSASRFNLLFLPLNQKQRVELNNKDGADFITDLDGGEIPLELLVRGKQKSRVAEDSICQDDRCSTELITGRDKEATR